MKNTTDPSLSRRRARSHGVIGPADLLGAVDPVLLNLICQGHIRIRGAVGNIVFRQTARGTVVSRKPDFSRVKWSPAQIAQRRRMQAAAQQYRVLMENPETKARYTQLAHQAGMPVSTYVIRELLRENR